MLHYPNRRTVIRLTHHIMANRDIISNKSFKRWMLCPQVSNNLLLPLAQIMGLVIEGRNNNGGGRRRPGAGANSGEYQKLVNEVEA